MCTLKAHRCLYCHHALDQTLEDSTVLGPGLRSTQLLEEVRRDSIFIVVVVAIPGSASHFIKVVKICGFDHAIKGGDRSPHHVDVLYLVLRRLTRQEITAQFKSPSHVL